MRRSRCASLTLGVLLASSRAAADEPTPPPRPPPYSLPWQLRPVVVGTGVRADTALASYEDASSRHGLTTASTLTATYRIPGTGPKGAGLAPVLRFAAVNESPPTGNGGLAIVNPLVGASYAVVLGGGFRLAGFLGATVPIGMGGGDTPDAALVAARSKGAFARSAMDNALFAVNDVTVIPGIGVAYVAGGLTLQLEATLFFLTRVRGDNAQPEASKANFTSGAHVGYFVAPALSLGLDVHYQHWLNAPLAVDRDTTGTLVDNATASFGPRFHFHLGGSSWIRPGVAYARGLDKPMAAATPNYNIIQVDVPVTF